MDPFITAIILTVLIVSGVWGSIILAGVFKRMNRRLESRADDPRITELQESHQLLEARLERLEEEVSFFRELNRPEPTNQLPPPDSNSSEPEP